MITISKIITAILSSLAITIGIGILVIPIIYKSDNFIAVAGCVGFGVIIIMMGLLPILGNEM